MTFVLDASVAVKWFLDEDGSALALPYRDEKTLAPTLILAEVSNAIWKSARRGRISRVDGLATMRLVPKILTDLVPDGDVIERAARLAIHHDHPIYDCVYLALALETGAPLLSDDARLLALAEASGAGTRPLQSAGTGAGSGGR